MHNVIEQRRLGLAPARYYGLNYLLYVIKARVPKERSSGKKSYKNDVILRHRSLSPEGPSSSLQATLRTTSIFLTLSTSFAKQRA